MLITRLTCITGSPTSLASAVYLLCLNICLCPWESKNQNFLDGNTALEQNKMVLFFRDVIEVQARQYFCKCAHCLFFATLHCFPFLAVLRPEVSSVTFSPRCSYQWYHIILPATGVSDQVKRSRVLCSIMEKYNFHQFCIPKVRMFEPFFADHWQFLTNYTGLLQQESVHILIHCKVWLTRVGGVAISVK